MFIKVRLFCFLFVAGACVVTCQAHPLGHKCFWFCLYNPSSWSQVLLCVCVSKTIILVAGAFVFCLPDPIGRRRFCFCLWLSFGRKRFCFCLPHPRDCMFVFLCIIRPLGRRCDHNFACPIILVAGVFVLVCPTKTLGRRCFCLWVSLGRRCFCFCVHQPRGRMCFCLCLYNPPSWPQVFFSFVCMEPYSWTPTLLFFVCPILSVAGAFDFVCLTHHPGRRAFFCLSLSNRRFGFCYRGPSS